MTSVAAFSEKRGDNLASGIIGFDKQNRQPLPLNNLSRSILLMMMMMIILSLHVHALLLTAIKNPNPSTICAPVYNNMRESKNEAKQIISETALDIFIIFTGTGGLLLDREIRRKYLGEEFESKGWP